MPQTFEVYSFPEDLVITEEMVFNFTQKIHFSFNKDILKHYKVNVLDVETFKKIMQDLIKEKTYGGRDSDFGDLLYNIVSTIIYDKNLANSFHFVKIDKYTDEEGHEQYDYFEYRSVDNVIKVCIKMIEDQIKLLEKYGKKVRFEID